MASVLPQAPTSDHPRQRLDRDLSTEPTWGMAAPSLGRIGPMAAARAAVPASPGDRPSLLDGFLTTEGLLVAAADIAAEQHAALVASAQCWYRFGRTPACLAAATAASARDARTWRSFAAEVRGLGFSVAAARVLARSAIQESDALRRYLEAEGLGTLHGERFYLHGELAERDLDAVRRAFGRVGYRSDQAAALRRTQCWAAPRLAELDAAASRLLASLSAASAGGEGASLLCDQIEDLMARAACAVLALPAEEPAAFGGPACGIEHFPYRERLTSLGRRLASVQGVALRASSSPLPDPRVAVADFSNALGALRGARLCLPLSLDEYANHFENLGGSMDRAAPAAVANRAAPACAHLARVQATHAALAGLLGPLAARQDVVADTRERLLAFASARLGQAARDPLPEPAAAVDLFYFSVTRGLAHLVADLDARQSELAACAQAFTALLDQTR